MRIQADRLDIYNPDNISVYDIERLIDKGRRFDIIDGYDEENRELVDNGRTVNG